MAVRDSRDGDGSRSSGGSVRLSRSLSLAQVTPSHFSSKSLEHFFSLSVSFRFSDMFPDKELVRGIQAELDQIIHAGVQNIVKLIHRTTRLDAAKDVSVTTEKTVQVIAAVNDESTSNDIRAIVGLQEEFPGREEKATPMDSTHKVLHSYLNALKTQAETRGHQFEESEDLIRQLISKGLLNQRSVDKLERQLASFTDNEKKIPKKRETSNSAQKKTKRK